MADIKQAVRWMKQGRRVRRPHFFGQFAYMACAKDMRFNKGNIAIVDNNQEECEPLNLQDLIANDWEIAELTGLKMDRSNA
jgi:hypothetical protein